MKFFIEKLKTISKWIWSAIGLYLLWIVIHHSAAYYYVQYCIPKNIYGIITTLILIPSPLCQALRWCIQHGADVVTSMWIVFGSWLIAFITIKRIAG
jgi:hypothetical protein